MDKNTLGHYGWIVIVVIIIIILISGAVPMVGLIKANVEYDVGGVKDKMNDALENIDIIGEPETITEYTPEQIDADAHIFAIGKTDPSYVLAIFNEDYSSVDIVKNGKDSDGLMKDWQPANVNSPMVQKAATLKNAVIKRGVLTVGSYAFFQCSELKNITFPSGFEKIGALAFFQCSVLTGVSFPKSLTVIGSQSFAYCKALKRIDVPKNVTTYYNNPFEGCSGLEIVSVASGNSEIHSVNNCIINSSTKTLLTGCMNSIIPTDGSVTGIGLSAFSGVSELANIAIPNSVTKIDQFAFSNCVKLENIVIPSSVKTISFNTFNNCAKLKSFNVSEENLYYSNDEYGALFNKDKTELYFYPLGNPRLSYTVPSEVVTIEANAFVNSVNLETIIITEGTTNIGGYTAAKNLINITIPSTVTAISSGTFKNCSSLKNIIFQGTKEQWSGITKYNNWDLNTPNYTIHCTDGDISK